MEAHAVVRVHPALAGPVVALRSTAEREKSTCTKRRQLQTDGMLQAQVSVLWQDTPVSPGGRRKPNLFVWSLFVDDVCAVVTAHPHCQHAALWDRDRPGIWKTHTHTHTQSY